jgi:selenocysteine lyase/cysteine desulfurase
VVTPDAPASRAGNVAFLHPDCERLADALAARQVLVWAGDGRVRLSLHVMNSLEDLDRFEHSLGDVLNAFMPAEASA